MHLRHAAFGFPGAALAPRSTSGHGLQWDSAPAIGELARRPRAPLADQRAYADGDAQSMFFALAAGAGQE